LDSVAFARRLAAARALAALAAGANNIVCCAGRACLISVTQATLSPTEEADAPISFRLAQGA